MWPRTKCLPDSQQQQQHHRMLIRYNKREGVNVIFKAMEGACWRMIDIGWEAAAAVLCHGSSNVSFRSIDHVSPPANSQTPPTYLHKHQYRGLNKNLISNFLIFLEVLRLKTAYVQKKVKQTNHLFSKLKSAVCDSQQKQYRISKPV